MSREYKDASRIAWHHGELDDGFPGNDNLVVGCFQRIADAQEGVAKASVMMARRYQDLIDERDRYKASKEYLSKENSRLCHVIAGLRGRIKRLTYEH